MTRQLHTYLNQAALLKMRSKEKKKGLHVLQLNQVFVVPGRIWPWSTQYFDIGNNDEEPEAVEAPACVEGGVWAALAESH